METVDYSGYQIEYFPEEFAGVSKEPLEERVARINVFKNGRKTETLKFVTDIRDRVASNLTTEQIINLALEKVREIIDKGLEDNEFKEFQFMGHSFEGIIDLTK